MRVLQRLLGRVERAGRELGRFQRLQSLGPWCARPSTPSCAWRRARRGHRGPDRPRSADLCASGRLPSAWPTREHRVADGVDDDPAVLVRKTSEGAEVWPRFTVATRSTWITCCSTSAGLLYAMAVRSSAPSTFWPRPVFCRAMSAASVPKAARDAVPKSTQATAARKGCSGVPVRYASRT